MPTDYLNMIEAADKWGPPNDPERRWFLAGWRDEKDSVPRDNAPPGNYATNQASWAAYNSGVVAARH